MLYHKMSTHNLRLLQQFSLRYRDSPPRAPPRHRDMKLNDAERGLLRLLTQFQSTLLEFMERSPLYASMDRSESTAHSLEAIEHLYCTLQANQPDDAPLPSPIHAVTDTAIAETMRVLTRNLQWMKQRNVEQMRPVAAVSV